ncbi:hypothetical protein [Chitinophaga varians]|uniref:hypothetical protein n=1 Tax=Chitinophaga varians TaxID=2202339 RepID=UPI00165F79AA|nr:hypothetical protein [Chitinophaga varians]MBC9912786.1 hypothetical protein [Chitinophaga varians]
MEATLNNNVKINRDNVQRLLIVYQEKAFFIGDTFIDLNEIRGIRAFFHHAVIDINLINKQNATMYNALLKNNPNLDNIHFSDWNEIDYTQYDAVICAANDEEILLKILHEKYDPCSDYNLAVFSISNFIQQVRVDARIVFPVNEALMEFITTKVAGKPREIYVSEEERDWADGWLAAKGMKATDKLYILLDSTTRRSKLISMNVYFDLLMGLLEADNVKVLVFDERSIGKRAFYKEWLGEENMKKMIFSESLSFREDLCLLASRHTRLVLGPCTGLLHCASGIYNHYLNNGASPKDIPLLITYTGQYVKREGNANYWWGSSPLMNCLLLKEKNNKKEITVLSSLTTEERNSYTQLPCSDYTAAMLLDFIRSKMKTPELVAQPV